MTPAYKGTAQPTANGGWLSGLTSWFGVPTPQYAGSGQPTGGASSTPYKPAPAAQSATCDDAERVTLVVPRELIEPQQ